MWYPFGVTEMIGAATDIMRALRLIYQSRFTGIVIGLVIIIMVPRLLSAMDIDIGDGSFNPITDLKAMFAQMAHR